MPDDLVARACAGDAQAFGLLHEAHVGRVYALCLRLCGDGHEAQELTQDVFVRVWERLPQFRGESALGSWIHRTAVNTVLERQRADRRRVARVAVHPDLEALRPALQRVPLDERLDLDTALARLAPGARTVFVLHAMEGYSFAELSELTGATEVALRSQLHRARTQLIAALRL